MTTHAKLYDDSLAEAIDVLAHSELALEIVAWIIQEKRSGADERAMRKSLKELEHRFWEHVVKTDTCWLWNGTGKNWYGSFSIAGRAIGAHRVSYLLANGLDSIPDGFFVDHLCHVRRCVNPDHLDAVTSRANSMNSDSPTAINARRTHCASGHPLSGENLFIESGKRRCRACSRKRSIAFKKSSPEYCERNRIYSNLYYARNREISISKARAYYEKIAEAIKAAKRARYKERKAAG